MNIFQAAVGPESGTDDFNITPRSNLNHMASVEHRRNRTDGVRAVAETIETDVFTIDELVSEYAESEGTLVILRMDIESFETEVFKGATDLFTSFQPVYAFVEQHNLMISEEELRKHCQRLDEFGLNIELVIPRDGKSTEPLCETWRELAEIDEIVHVFAHRQ